MGQVTMATVSGIFFPEIKEMVCVSEQLFHLVSSHKHTCLLKNSSQILRTVLS